MQKIKVRTTTSNQNKKDKDKKKIKKKTVVGEIQAKPGRRPLMDKSINS